MSTHSPNQSESDSETSNHPDNEYISNTQVIETLGIKMENNTAKLDILIGLITQLVGKIDIPTMSSVPAAAAPILIKEEPTVIKPELEFKKTNTRRAAKPIIKVEDKAAKEGYENLAYDKAEQLNNISNRYARVQTLSAAINNTEYTLNSVDYAAIVRWYKKLNFYRKVGGSLFWSDLINDQIATNLKRHLSLSDSAYVELSDVETLEALLKFVRPKNAIAWSSAFSDTLIYPSAHRSEAFILNQDAKMKMADIGIFAENALDIFFILGHHNAPSAKIVKSILFKKMPRNIAEMLEQASIYDNKTPFVDTCDKIIEFVKSIQDKILDNGSVLKCLDSRPDHSDRSPRTPSDGSKYFQQRRTGLRESTNRQRINALPVDTSQECDDQDQEDQDPDQHVELTAEEQLELNSHGIFSFKTLPQRATEYNDKRTKLFPPSGKSSSFPSHLQYPAGPPHTQIV